MSEHLSSRQIDECLLGESGPETRHHLRKCSACQAELARLQDRLASFRHTIRAWSDQQLPVHTRSDWEVKPMRSKPFSKLSLAIVAVACLVLALLFPRQKSQPIAPSPADAALLSEIDAEVSRTVPGPMEPLTEFVLSDSSTQRAAGQSARKEARP